MSTSRIGKSAGSDRPASSAAPAPVLPPQPSIDTPPIPITKQEIEAAFKFFSQDGKKITKEDIKRKIEDYFPNMSLDSYKLLVNSALGQPPKTVLRNGKPVSVSGMNVPPSSDYMTEEMLMKMFGAEGEWGIKMARYRSVFFEKDLPYDKAFDLFEPDRNENIPDHVLRKMITMFNQNNASAAKLLLRYDRRHLMFEFDRDGDGQIGIDDLITLMEKKNDI